MLRVRDGGGEEESCHAEQLSCGVSSRAIPGIENQVALGGAEGWRSEETRSLVSHVRRRWLKGVTLCSRPEGEGSEARREWQKDGGKELRVPAMEDGDLRLRMGQKERPVCPISASDDLSRTFLLYKRVLTFAEGFED